MLAALAAVPGSSFAPVQAQKFFFLLDRNVSAELGGPLFAFEPYDYGPFDRSVYSELEDLARRGLVAIDHAPGAARRKYGLTAAGHEIGAREIGKMPQRFRDYAPRLSEWVRSLSFADLVGAIYAQYPDMKVNSVFRG